MSIKIISSILGFIVMFLGIKNYSQLGIKGILMIIFGLLIVISNVYSIIVDKSKEKEYIEYKADSNYEEQKTRLISMGLPESYIENLGGNPLLKQVYKEGQEYEKTGSYEKAIESYEEILKYRLSSDVDKVSAYNLVGYCHFNLHELEKAMQNFQKALDLIEKIKEKKDKSNGKMITFYNIGCAYKELARWENAKKYLEDSLKESIRLDDNLHKATTLSNISDIYFQLNKPKIAIKKINQSIQAYQEALKVYHLDDFPTEHAIAQYDLGITYCCLAEVQDRVVNFENAIRAYQEALKVYTLNDFPEKHASTQNNLGNVYDRLAQVQDKVKNCNLALQAYQEALKQRTFDQFPIDYATTQMNIGVAYRTLSQAQDKVINCEKAICALQEALKLYSLNNFPIDYAKTQENLGVAYGFLAQVQDKAKNYNLALQAYQEALKIYTLDDSPMGYAMVQYNLGTTHYILAKVKDMVINYQKAIQVYQEALKVYALDNFPIDYATTNYFLGNVYYSLAEVQDKTKNHKLAVKVYQEALKVFTKNKFPEEYRAIQEKIKKCK